MPDPRRSYLKTTLVAAFGGLAGVVLLGWLSGLVWLRAGNWNPVLWLLCAAAAAVLAVAVAGLGLVALGGLIAVRRTGLEVRGAPYASPERREWLPGPVAGRIRKVARRIGALLVVDGRGLRPGDVVEVRSLDEILPTLDEHGLLDGLPFMPEMAAFCGERFRVFRRVEKIHDYVTHTGLRRMRSAVLLDQLRCDGGAHGGCEARCHLIWKEAWLRPAEAGAAARSSGSAEPHGRQSGEPAIDDTPWMAWTSTRDPAGEVRYVCQMTEVARASAPLSWGDPRHYMRDLASGNVRPWPLMRGVAIAAFNGIQHRRGGITFPYYSNTGQKASPHAVLDLQPGELVRVRTKREIEETLNIRRRNRGLWFDGEMLRFCGGVYRVAARVERLVDEKSGTLLDLSNPCVVLEGVTASGEYLALCPQNEVIFWREIWLERIPVRDGE